MTSTEAAYAATRINRRTFALAWAEAPEDADCYVQVEAAGGRFPIKAIALHSDDAVEAFIRTCNARVEAWAVNAS